MTMDIQLHSRLGAEDLALKISEALAELKDAFGKRFWFSDVIRTGNLTREVLIDEFGFLSESNMVVTDTTKQFDDFNMVARMLRSAVGEDQAIVIYCDTGKLFPEVDYPATHNVS